MRRLFLSLSAVALVSAFLAAPEAAAQQSVNFYAGGFVPRGQDARGTDDVLFQNGNFLSFDIKDFSGAAVGGEWLVALGDYLDAGLGLGYYQRTVPSIYTLFQNRDGSEIEQDLKLRVVPFTATVRFLPLGHQAAVTPYIGAGVGLFSWRYSETGQFVDFRDNSIFRDTFIGSGTKAGPVILGGIMVPIGSASIGGEIRYQSAKGDLPAAEDFAGSTIDLGGLNYLFMINVRF